jgi:hypothetical protein
MNANQLAEQIARYAARESECESRFLYPHPQHYLYSADLMEFLIRTGSCTTAEVQSWTNNETDNLKEQYHE